MPKARSNSITFRGAAANDFLKALMAKPKPGTDPVITAAENFDWGQPGARWAPCFHLGSDGYFCGRAPVWDGHGESSHPYLSLADLIRNLKK